MKLFEGDKDYCKLAENQNVQKVAKMLGLDKVSHCPNAAGKSCTDENHPINMGPAAKMMGAAKGKLSVHFDIKHDNGVSCIDAEIEIFKK